MELIECPRCVGHGGGLGEHKCPVCGGHRLIDSTRLDFTHARDASGRTSSVVDWRAERLERAERTIREWAGPGRHVKVEYQDRRWRCVFVEARWPSDPLDDAEAVVAFGSGESFGEAVAAAASRLTRKAS